MQGKVKYSKKEVIKMRKGEIIPANQGKVWTKEEKSTLTSMCNSGCGITEISIELQRTESSVIQRARKLNLLNGRIRKKKETRKHLFAESQHHQDRNPRYNSNSAYPK